MFDFKGAGIIITVTSGVEDTRKILLKLTVSVEKVVVNLSGL